MLLKFDGWLRAGWCGLAVSCGLWLSGCQSISPPPEAAPAPPPAVVAPAPSPPAVPEAVANKLDEADEAARHVLAYHERLRQLSSAELNQELSRLNMAPGGPATTLETALALGQTRNPADLARGLSLLDSLVRMNTPELQPWQPIARLIAVRFAEQRRVEEQVDRLNMQLRDSQRDSQRKLDQLNEKLEALKAIERSLTVRPPAVAAPPSSAPKAP